MKLRYIFASVLMFAFVTLVAWAYNKVVLKGDTGLTVPLIKAETGAYKVPPQNPGGLEIPHQDSSIYNMLDERRSSDESVKFSDYSSGEEHKDNEPLLKKGFILERGKLAEDKPLTTESLFDDSRDAAIARAKRNIEQQQPFVSDTDIRQMKDIEDKKPEMAAPEEVDAGIIIADAKKIPDHVKAPKPLGHPRRSSAKEIVVVKAEPAPQEKEEPKQFSDVLKSLETNETVEELNVVEEEKIDLNAYSEVHEYAVKVKPSRGTALVMDALPSVEAESDEVVQNSFVQLASLPNESAASKEWAVLKQRYWDLLGKLPVRYKTVDIEGRGRYTRIQAGPLTEEEARAKCAALVDAGKQSGCIVVTD